MILTVLCLALSCYHSVSGSNAEYNLQSSLLKDHDPTVIPIKNISVPRMVTFDIALRSIQSLEEKDEMLKISAWIRMSWKNDYLVWDPRNHSGVQSINVARDQVWKPDVVLYNSAADSGSGLLFDKMTTDVVVRYDGTSKWYYPLILQSECSVDLRQFPFDHQTCPLTFGLWNIPLSLGPRVNLSIAHPFGDIKNYQKNGVFELNEMPGKMAIVYYPCCPDLPYTRLKYEIKVTRRTVFYMMDFFLPTLVLNVLLFVTYILPPESGERMTLSISLLLAFVLHMLHISEHIPPTSDSFPMITRFLNVSVILSGLTLLSSAIVVKWSLFKYGENHVPWLIRVVFNKYLARVFCAKGATYADSSSVASRKPGQVNIEDQSECHQNGLTTDSLGTQHGSFQNMCSYVEANPDSIVLHAKTHTEESASGVARRARSSRSLERYDSERSEFTRVMCANLRVITKQLDGQELEEAYHKQWRLAICVMDRLSCLISFVYAIGTAIYLLFYTSRVYIK